MEKRYWLLKAQSRTGRFDLETFIPLVSPPIHASLSEGNVKFMNAGFNTLLDCYPDTVAIHYTPCIHHVTPVHQSALNFKKFHASVMMMALEDGNYIISICFKSEILNSPIIF